MKLNLDDVLKMLIGTSQTNEEYLSYKRRKHAFNQIWDDGVRELVSYFFFTAMT